MKTENVSAEKKKITAASAKKIAFAVYDVLISFVSYFMAIVFRFYANHEFHVEAGLYLKPFYSFAPFYAVIVVGVFAFFRLYNGKWKYAGYHDFGRIIKANLVTALVQILAMKLIFGDMPLSYYCYGALLQFILVTFSRFIPRLMYAVSDSIKRKIMPATNVLIVGDGDMAFFTRKLMEGNNINNVFVKCFFSEKPEAAHTMIDGIPVESELENLENRIKENSIEFVCVADTTVSSDTMDRIRSICDKANVVVKSLPEIPFFDEFLELS